ncbi:hypothetical protein LNV09_10040 [Paucibacter sp. B2R-40]|uniref:hypothetical protein n=1 Tax=Paucibacter sp. B2R-40 TaxID=2893554 RepID=UPI0021E4763D|nr:hypothetical protein [Paucibacter sp. B2R-40]MCV2354502.1 hypothetical protein [Paucibacter sp. B2R-40]
MKRSAAPFHLQLQPLPALQGLMAFVGLCAVLSLALAFIEHFPECWLLLGLSPLGGCAAWRSARVVPRVLRWDGQAWHLHEPVQLLPYAQGVLPRTTTFNPALDTAAPVHLLVAFDLGFCLLLRARRTAQTWAAPAYLPLTRSTQGAHWAQLRAVLYSARQSSP